MGGRPNRRNKAAFSDGLVRMEGLTVEVKLWFFMSAAQCGRAPINIHVILKCVLLLKCSIDKSM